MAITAPTQVPSTAGHPVSPWTRDLLTALFGLWTIIGLFVDGWAHMNLDSTTESFFTPWHAILYSGFVVGATWIALPALRTTGGWRERFAALPYGYGLGFVGAVVFALGGVADSTWHTVLGIETDIDALLSPPHLLLLTGGLTMLTTPLRATSGRVRGTDASFRDLLPALVSLLLVLAAVSFFLEYIWPDVPARPSAEASAFFQEAYPADGYVVFLADATTLVARFLGAIVIVGGLTVIATRWTLPTGAVTFLLGTVTLLHFAMGGFPLDAGLVFGAPIAAALLTEALVVWKRPRPGDRTGLLIVATALPTLWFGLQMVAIGVLYGGIAWEVGLVGGAIVGPAMFGAAIALIATPMQPPSEPSTSTK